MPEGLGESLPSDKVRRRLTFHKIGTEVFDTGFSGFSVGFSGFFRLVLAGREVPTEKPGNPLDVPGFPGRAIGKRLRPGKASQPSKCVGVWWGQAALFGAG